MQNRKLLSVVYTSWRSGLCVCAQKVQSGPLAKSSGIFHAETRGTAEDSPYCDNKGIRTKMITAATDREEDWLLLPKVRSYRQNISKEYTHTHAHTHTTHTLFTLSVTVRQVMLTATLSGLFTTTKVYFSLKLHI